MQFELDIRGDRQAAASLYKLGAKAAHAEPILNRLGDKLFELEQMRFAKGRFKPLAASTKARKRRQGLPRRPLQGATGRLQASLIHRGALNIFNVDANELRFGSKVRYGFYHQYGVGVPKRQPLALTPKQRRALAGMILEYLKGDA